jgi:hypothetical protein
VCGEAHKRACRQKIKFYGKMSIMYIDRFFEKVDKTDDCWNWLASKKWDGYGQVKFEGSMQTAHRTSWILHNGPVPEKLCVLHKCDNPGCVNPEHLFLGTQRDNVHDAIKKGRHVNPPPRYKK